MNRHPLIVSARQALPTLATVTRALGFIACTSALTAATQDWNGAGTDWNTDANWTSAVPVAADVAKFDSIFSNQPSVDADSTVGALWGGTSLGQNVTIGGAAALTLQGNLTVDGLGTTGLLWQSGYNLTVNPTLTLGFNTTFRSNGAGTVSLTAMNFNGKTLTLAGTDPAGVMAIAGSSTGNGSMIIDTAGTVRLTGSHGYSGSTTLTAGKLDISTGVTLNSTLTSALGTDITGTGELAITVHKAMTLNGTVSGGLTLRKNQNVLTLTNANNTYTGGTVLVGSATLAIGSNTALGTGALSTEANSNTIRSDSTTARTLANNVVLGGSVTFGSATDATVNGNLSFGDLSLGSANRQLTVNTALTSFGSLTSSATTAVLDKRGTGTLLIRDTGTSAYTGRLFTGAGTLLVDADLSTMTGASGNNTVSAGATLGGSGKIGGSTTVTGAVSPGGNGTADTVGTLTFTNNLLLNTTTTKLTFDLGAVGASDQIVLNSGSLNIGTGLLEFDDFTFNTLAGFTGGTYTLIDVQSLTSITGTLGANLTGTVGGQAATLSTLGNDLILTVAAIPEPSTVAVLLGGVALSVAAVLRRRTAKIA